MDKYEVLVNMYSYAQLYLERRIEETKDMEKKNMDYIHQLEDVKELFLELSEKTNKETLQ